MPETNEKKVKDLMTPIEEYSTVRADSTVKEAIAVLKKSIRPGDPAADRVHRSILILDGNGEIAGILTLRTLLQAIEPRFIKVDQWAVPVFWEGLFTDRCREEAAKKVGELMIPVKLISLDAGDTIIKAVHAMLKHKLDSLPVSRNGKIVGMVRSTEIFQEIISLVADQPGAGEALPDLRGAVPLQG